MQFNALLRQTGSMIILVVSAWLWQVYGHVLANEAVIASLAVFACLIGLGLWQRAKTRRRVWLNAYLLTQSPLNRWLKGGLLMASLQAVSALVLAVYLAVTVVRIHSLGVWVSLLLVALAFPAVSYWVARLLEAHTKVSYKQVLSMRLAALGLGVLLLSVLIFESYHASYPDFRTANLDQSIWYMVSATQARSTLLLHSLEFVAAADGLRYWLAQRLLPAPATSLWQVIAWCWVLAQEALFVWSYLMLCTGALSLHNTIIGVSSSSHRSEDARRD